MKKKSKRFCAWILTVLIFSTIYCAGFAVEKQILGDLNGDGQLQKADVVALLEQLQTIQPLSDILNSDLNHDYLVNSVDLSLLKRMVLAEQETHTVHVTDVASLQKALQNAVAGQIILLEPGNYSSSAYGNKGALFASSADGTAQQPITIRSADIDHPAVLSGVDTASGIVLYITGDFWKVEHLVCTTAQKGIVLDNSNYSVLTDCTVSQIGSEGIHLRDNSSNCLVEYCTVHDTGVVSPQYGEAIYIGSAYSTTSYGYDCYDNRIAYCRLGPNVAAEHIDVKEYTKGTMIEYCTMDGAGMSGANGGDSFVDLKGNQCTVRYNTCNSNGCPNLKDAFQSHSQVAEWGYDNIVYGNLVTLDQEEQYILRIWADTSCTAYDNTRIPLAGNMYRAFDNAILSLPTTGSE